jgi:hypothetical protein
VADCEDEETRTDDEEPMPRVPVREVARHWRENGVHAQVAHEHVAGGLFADPDLPTNKQRKGELKKIKIAYIYNHRPQHKLCTENGLSPKKRKHTKKNEKKN